MSKAKILVVWSNYYEALAEKQLQSCIQLLDASEYDYDIETITAGTYEIPAVIKHFSLYQPYDGYIPLGLLLKGGTDHYAFIWEHVKSCFIEFAMEGISLGNGVISAPSIEMLTERIENNERVKEAFHAVDYLIKLKSRISGI